MIVKEYTSYKCGILKNLMYLNTEWKHLYDREDSIIYYPKDNTNFVSRLITIMYFIKQDEEGNIVARQIKVISSKEIIKNHLDSSRLFIESIKWLNK